MNIQSARSQRRHKAVLSSHTENNQKPLISEAQEKRSPLNTSVGTYTSILQSRLESQITDLCLISAELNQNLWDQLKNQNFNVLSSQVSYSRKCIGNARPRQALLSQSKEDQSSLGEKLFSLMRFRVTHCISRFRISRRDV